MHSRTLNNAVQYATAGDPLVDLFYQIGASSTIPEAFPRAYATDRARALKIVLFGRAVRAGAGRRDVYRQIMDVVFNVSPQFIGDNALALARVGYWKDLRRWATDEVVAAWAQEIKNQECGNLAAKWAPRKGELAKRLRDALKVTNAGYRKLLHERSLTVEQKLCARHKITNFDWVPSVALQRYTKTFNSNPLYSEAFANWKTSDSVASASAVWPHQVVQLLSVDPLVAEKQWAALPNYLEPGELIFPICDVSGSMEQSILGTTAMQVCVSLGLYLAERNVGAFQNKFITFSRRPKVCTLTGSLSERHEQLRTADWGQNTDFEAVYRLILDGAILHGVPQEQMPTMLLVLSDMQFDEAGELPHLEEMRVQFARAGYKLPKLVFWNLVNYDNGVPATVSDENVALVSGFSPVVMKAILSAKNFTARDIVEEALTLLPDLNMEHAPSSECICGVEGVVQDSCTDV